MERYDRDRNRYNNDSHPYDRNNGYGQYGNQPDQHRQNYRQNDAERYRNGNSQEQDRYQNNHQNPYGNSQDRHYDSPNHYRRDQGGQHPYQNNFSQDRDQFGSPYQSDFRQDPTLRRGGEEDDLMGNIRQGYGISSYDGTSDRFNTLNSEQRYGARQDEQPYYSGNRDGYQRSQFGGGMGESGMHSHRGIPDYGTHNFADNEGIGMGSTYGGTNYGGGRGYSGGHRGGTLGNSSYGSYAGNYGGFGPGGSTYGAGRSSFGESAHNSDRGASELGGF